MTTPLTQLDAAIELVRKALRSVGNDTDTPVALSACMDLIRDHGPALRAALADAERYRFLRDPRRLPEGATDEYGHVYVGISGLDRWAVASVEADFAIDRAIAASKEPA